MPCLHDKVIKDWSSNTKAFKITLCPKCNEVLNIIMQGDKPKEETEKQMWANKERREHKRALTMQAFNLFPPITSDSHIDPMDRWLQVKDLRDCMLTDLYND